MKVLQLSQDYLPKIGGIAAHVHSLSVALQACGCEVTVATMRGSPRNFTDWRIRREYLDGVDTINFPVLYSPRNVLRGAQQSLRYGAHLQRLMKREGHLLFHWHTWGEDIRVANRLRRYAPAVFTNHSSMFLADHAAGKRAEVLAKMAMADLVLAPSAELVSKTIEAGIARDRVVEIDNGVDLDRYAPISEAMRGPLRDRLFGSSIGERPVFICARRWVPKTGVHVLLDALERLLANPDFMQRAPLVAFLGNPGPEESSEPYIARLHQSVEKLRARGLDIRLLGRVPILQTSPYYQSADFSLLPSLVEAKSLAALESMASGAVVVATNAGGLEQLIEDGRTGFKVGVDDAAAFADGMQRALSSPNLPAIRSAARAFVSSRYSWRAVAEHHIDLYRKALALRGLAPG